MRSYFGQQWRGQFNAPGQIDEREQLEAHLAALLDLDADRQPVIGIDPEIVRQAREAIVNLPLADQAYALIKERAATAGIRDFNLAERLSGQVALVLHTADEAPLDTIGVPALYTFEGYWGYFLEELTAARGRLREDQWVLGEAAGRVGYETQLAGLEAELHRFTGWSSTRPGRQCSNASGWRGCRRMRRSTGRWRRRLHRWPRRCWSWSKRSEEETRLSRLYEQLDNLDPAAVAASGGDLSANMGDAVFKRIYSKSGVFQKVALDSFKARGKVQAQAGAAGQAHGEDMQRRQVKRSRTILPVAQPAEWRSRVAAG